MGIRNEYKQLFIDEMDEQSGYEMFFFEINFLEYCDLVNKIVKLHFILFTEPSNERMTDYSWQ